MERKKNLFTILLCTALILTVILVKIFSKDDNKEIKDDKETVSNTSISATPTITVIPQVSTTLIKDKEIKDDNEMEEVIDKEIDYENEEIIYKEITFELKNGEALWNLIIPSGVYTNLLDEIQGFIEDNISDYKDITEVKVFDSPIEIKDDILRFYCSLNNKSEDILSINVDIKSFKYNIVKAKIEK